MLPMTRRAFIGSAAVAASVALTPLSRVLGANEDIRMAFIGLGGRGGAHVPWFSEQPGTRVVGFCEPDRSRLAPWAEKYPQAHVHTDVCKLLEHDDIDAVVISSCNHWHALSSIWAVQAGKDVYVEKPVSHNVWEGRKLVEAARKYNRIVQGGTQQRSDPMQDEIKAYLDSGELGPMRFVRLNHFGVRDSIGKRDTPLPIPDHVDYDQWLGPAQDLPMYRSSFQYDWHWVWNTGNGELGNWAPHILDDCRNVVFRDRVTLPARVCAGGGRFVWDDAGETPNTAFVYFDTGVVPVVMASHNLPMRAGTNQGDLYERLRTRAFLIIQCENGYYAGGRGGGAAYSNDGQVIQRFKGDAGGGHAANFLAAVRSRNQADLKAEIEEIHYSCAWGHLGNIACRLGAPYSREEALSRLPASEPWQELIHGFEAHLHANDVDLSAQGAVLSPMLEIDPKRETFIGPTATGEAKALLRRDYREPYVVRDEV